MDNREVARSFTGSASLELPRVAKAMGTSWWTGAITEQTERFEYEWVAVSLGVYPAAGPFIIQMWPMERHQLTCLQADSHPDHQA